MTNITIISDLHCGHRAGLTPPSWQYPDQIGESRTENVRDGFAKIQRAEWDWYKNAINKCDILIVNGDAIDGKGTKSGSAEQITSDRDEQIAMAAECINQFNAKKIFVIEGTPYHAGLEESWEALLADAIHAEHYGIHEQIKVEDFIFDIRHKVGSSCIPHGRFTAPAREALWNALWSERGITEKADVIIRSHVHYFTVAQDSKRLVMTTPALQVYSKFGSREISGTNDIGFINFIIDDNKYMYQYQKFDVSIVAPSKLWVV